MPEPGHDNPLRNEAPMDLPAPVELPPPMDLPPPMGLSPRAGLPMSPVTSERARPQRRSGYEWALLGALALVVLGLMAMQHFGAAAPTDEELALHKDEVPPADVMMRMEGRYAVGLARLMSSTPAGQRTRALGDLQDQVDQLAVTPADQIRAAIVAGEVLGQASALSRLDQLGGESALRIMPLSDDLAQDVDRLRRLYKNGQDALEPEEKQAIAQRYDWFGDLALSHGLPDESEMRQRAVAPTTRTVVGLLTMFVAGGGAFLVGIVLLIIAIVMISKGRFRWALSPTPQPGPLGWGGRPQDASGAPYGPPPGPYYYAQPWPPPAPPVSTPVPPTASLAANGESRVPYLEAFILFLLGIPAVHLITAVLPNQVPHEIAIQLVWLLAIVPFWVRLRGASWRAMRSALGWHTGRGVIREVGAGIVGYIAGLPLLVIGVIATFVLMTIGQAAVPLFHANDPAPLFAPVPDFPAGPDGESAPPPGSGVIDADGAGRLPTPVHPIVNELASASVGQIALLFALAAVWAPLLEETMFRGALHHYLRGRWTILASALFGGFIFAAIHPQGIYGIPPLMALGATFAMIREWRGSLIATITAHACNNAMMLTMVVLVAR